MPDRDTLKKMFDEIVTKSVSRICTKHKQLINLQELTTFIKSNDASEEKSTEDSIDLQ